MLARHDRPAALALVHPEAEFIDVKRAAQARLPLYGTFRGRAGAEAFLQGLADAFQTEQFEHEGLLGDEHTAVAWGSFRHRVRATGRLFESDWALVCRVRDGLIAFHQFYEDTEALERSFNLLPDRG
ncbi:nuclear transport factor 2 family protein [Hymenobacter terrenus]|uniref:nuclear transport factor 2 family protein n=1 Tax=Hymenobacter terrenus TaxID=1629124 RepID=UPI000619BBFD|nr:nuclear transport factor 2 family protein [Hymenobacter terrenus]